MSWLFETHTIYRGKDNVVRDRREVVTAESDREARDILIKRVERSGGKVVGTPYLNRRYKK